MKIKAKKTGAVLDVDSESMDFVTLALPLDSCPDARHVAEDYANRMVANGEMAFANAIFKALARHGGKAW